MGQAGSCYLLPAMITQHSSAQRSAAVAGTPGAFSKTWLLLAILAPLAIQVAVVFADYRFSRLGVTPGLVGIAGFFVSCSVGIACLFRAIHTRRLLALLIYLPTVVLLMVGVAFLINGIVFHNTL